MQTIINIEKLCFSYGAGRVLSDVNFTAKKGTLTAVMGPNGVGKTTLFKCILGLLNKYQGRIEIAGKEIKSMSVRELAHNVAYIPQIHKMPFSYSVKDIILMGTAHRMSAVSSPGKLEKNIASEVMQKLNITGLAERNFSQLSGGEQQMVLIARALAQGTDIIIMDEPTASLDYGNQSIVLSKVHELAQSGYTILMSTHNPQHALWYADTALAMYKGEVIAKGRPEVVLNSDLIYRLFAVHTEFINTPQGVMIVPERKRVLNV